MSGKNKNQTAIERARIKQEMGVLPSTHFCAADACPNSGKPIPMGEMLDKLKALNTNVVAFQARPESDALYRSTIDPWSRFLTGTSGKDPGWDPLEFLFAEAH